jgi:hypothetical protein
MCFFLKKFVVFFPKKIYFWFFPKTVTLKVQTAVDGVCDDERNLPGSTAPGELRDA